MQPRVDDFEVRDENGSVLVIFKPTDSHFSFGRLDPSERQKHGPVSRFPNIRHAKTGDTGDYVQADVQEMAYQIASRHAG